MHTPVFLDHLPDITSVSSRKSELYRLTRNRALLDLMLDDHTSWHRRDCPACGQPRIKSKSFSQALLPFQRCTGCNTIYAPRLPSQQTLDTLRLDTVIDHDEEQNRDFEFTSLLNWISLTEVRSERSLETVLDYRFSAQAPAWPLTAQRLTRHRKLTFLPLQVQSEAESYCDLQQALQAQDPRAVLVLAEMDRVADPALLLRSIQENVARGTLVFIATSCADGLEYEILGADSPSFIPLDRLTVFSVSGFEALAQKLGFNVLEVSTPGRLDAVILDQYFKATESSDIPFWSSFFREADNNRLRDLQILLQRSLKSSVMRFVLET
ncbi:MAG: hypothetical protein HRU33_17775 [Rhodobacteraceae bacterium]|nr:hypothetical protein [Paracoccaceae bacterium]